jgi:hypothetical protein
MSRGIAWRKSEILDMYLENFIQIDI